MKSFSSFKLEEAKATYTIKDSEGNIKHAGTDKDMAYKTHKSLNAKEAGHKLYKNGVATLAEVLNKDAKAGDWISDFIKSDNPKFAGKSEAKRKEMALAAYYAKQKNEAVMQPNGTDKVEPDAGMCQVCGATDCKEHFYKSPAVTGYVKEATVNTSDVNKNKNIAQSDKDKLGKLAALMAKQKKPIKEESGEHHDYAHVKKTMKKVDFDTYAKHMNKNDADHSMENKHKVDTQHSGSYTGKIHGAEVSHKVSGSGQKEYYIKEETLDEEFSNDTMKRIHKEYLYHKSRSTADVLKTHKGIHRVQSQNYTAGEMGGKEGLISDIMHNKHGKKRMDHYHSMKPSERKSLSEESLDEISKETLGNYIHKSFARGNEIHKQLDKQVDDVQSPEERAKLKAELSKRNSGVIKAAQKMRNESQEKKPYIVISHVSDNTGTRADGEKVEKNRVATKLIATSPEHALQLSKAHHTKAGRKVHSAVIKEEKIVEATDTVKKDSSGKVIAWSHEGDWEKMSTKKQGTGKAANLAGQALQKTKTLNKEEAELEEGLFDKLPSGKAGQAYLDKKRDQRNAEHEKQDPKMAKVYAKNMVDTAKAAKKANERGITKHADDFGWQVRNGVQRGKLPEEVELDEAWEVYDTKTRAIHSSHPTQRKALNAMNKLNDKHPGYETPGNLIASKFGARASGIKEGTQTSPGEHFASQSPKMQDAINLHLRKGKSYQDAVEAAKKHVKEEVELDEAAWGKDKATNLRQAHDRHMEKALAANKAGDDEAVKTHQRKMQMIQGKLQKLKNNEEVELSEECEILSELSKNALGNYAKAAAFDIANKGSAVAKAGNNLAVLANPKGPLTQLNKRLQGHAKAVEKLTKEEVEEFMQTEAYDQLDELSKATLGSYVKKASEQGKKAAVGANQSGRGATDALSNGNANLHDLHVDNYKYSKNLEKKRAAGVSKAVDKLTKEDTMLTYSEFMAQLAESRADDLKDKLAADREARLNNYDYSKEKAAKKNPVTKVKGHSYGAGDEDGEAEPAKAAEPAEKRGRGRPAGSKSGARA
jgi:hypothetical protein